MNAPARRRALSIVAVAVAVVVGFCLAPADAAVAPTARDCQVSPPVAIGPATAADAPPAVSADQGRAVAAPVAVGRLAPVRCRALPESILADAPSSRAPPARG